MSEGTPVDRFCDKIGKLIEELDEETGVEVRRIKVNRVSVPGEGYGRSVSVVKSIELEMS